MQHVFYRLGDIGVLGSLARGNKDERPPVGAAFLVHRFDVGILQVRNVAKEYKRMVDSMRGAITDGEPANRELVRCRFLSSG